MQLDYRKFDPICPGFTIQPIDNHAGFQRCVDLQNRIWKYTDSADVVPTALLAITPHNGGILLGAFDTRRRMVGFVYSILGFHQGGLVQHSHMLGVLAGYRGRNIGLALKLAQRKTALRQGISRVVWTYDPLQARNAHFNLNLLGAWVDTYEVNFYGNSSSPLHRGLDTDRFLAVWDLNNPGVKRRALEARRHAIPGPTQPDLPVFDSFHQVSDSLAYSPAGTARAHHRPFLFELPPDIDHLKSEQPADAVQVQLQLRKTSLHCFARGYRVTRFFSDPSGRHRHCYYLFEHPA
jgi:predicted GNAT superfamily acetyltransferase